MAEPSDAPEFLTTREVAALLRVKERKVYELVANRQLPCRRLTGKLLFPRHEIDAWIGEGRGAGPAKAAAAMPPNVVGGSHDPLLDWALRASGAGLATMFDGSLDGLERMARGEAVAAGLHVPEDSAVWNLAHVEAAVGERPFVLVEWARRQQGLIVQRAERSVTQVADLRGRRVAARQPAAGGAILFARLLAEAGLSPGDVEPVAGLARTEIEAAAAVASGKADAALGLEAMARQFDLGFVPLVSERYDLLIDRRAYFEPPLQTLLAFAAGAELAAQAEEIGGYDLSGAGTVHWNGP